MPTDEAERSAPRPPLKPILLTLILAVVLLSRLPFIGAGYGWDDDAWRIAVAGRAISTTGEYSVSRFPGYPVPELAATLLWRGGPLALNGATALIGTAAVGLFMLLLQWTGGRQTLAAGLAFAMTPVVFINSTTIMDYVWALFFILAALCLAMRDRPILSGLALGLAIGCRLTSAAFIVPVLLLPLPRTGPRGTVRRGLIASSTAGIVATALYLPGVMRYGWELIGPLERADKPFRVVLRTATIEVWGELGLIALAIAALSLIPRLRLLATLPTSAELLRGRPFFTGVWAVSLALCGAVYLLHPNEAGYLVPAVPFMILLLDSIANRKVFALVCLLLFLSPFLSPVRSGLRPGPIFEDHTIRLRSLANTDRIMANGATMSGKCVVVVGTRRLPRIKAALPADAVDLDGPFPPAVNIAPAFQGSVAYVSRLGEADMRVWEGDGYGVYYVDDIADSNRVIAGLDLRRSRARAIRIN